MTSTTMRELVIGISSSFIVLAIAKSYRWLSDRLDAWSDKQATKNLNKMESNPALYADKTLRNMRLALCMAGYFFGCAFVILALSTDLRPLSAFFAFIAVVACAMAGGYSSASTIEGVYDRSKRTRKRLKLTERQLSR